MYIINYFLVTVCAVRKSVACISLASLMLHLVSPRIICMFSGTKHVQRRYVDSEHLVRCFAAARICRCKNGKKVWSLQSWFRGCKTASGFCSKVVAAKCSLAASGKHRFPAANDHFAATNICNRSSRTVDVTANSFETRRQAVRTIYRQLRCCRGKPLSLRLPPCLKPSVRGSDM